MDGWFVKVTCMEWVINKPKFNEDFIKIHKKDKDNISLNLMFNFLKNYMNFNIT